MNLNKLSENELRELDEYLQDDELNEIYNEIKNTDYSEHFEPLPFIRLYLEQVEFVEQNKSKPKFVLKTLDKLKYTEKQKQILFEYLRVHFDWGMEDDTDIRIICRLIDEIENEKTENNEVESKNQSTFDFDKVLKHIETLEPIQEKIAYLVSQQTKYNQEKNGWEMILGTDFGTKCELEIKKLEKLARLNSPQKIKTVEVAKNKDLTIDRVIFLFNRLIPTFTDCEATKKAEFINFLTGFDYETVRQRFSSIHRKDADKPQAFKKDMEIVCKYLKVLGLDQKIAQIKKDLEFQ